MGQEKIIEQTTRAFKVAAMEVKGVECKDEELDKVPSGTKLVKDHDLQGSGLFSKQNKTGSD